MKLKNARSDAMQEYEWQNLLLILVLKAKRGDQRRRCEGKNPESYKTHTNTTLTTHGFFMLLAKSNLHGGGREWTLDSLKKIVIIIINLRRKTFSSLETWCRREKKMLTRTEKIKRKLTNVFERENFHFHLRSFFPKPSITVFRFPLSFAHANFTFLFSSFLHYTSTLT